MDNILEVSGINKSYDDFSLKDISFYLPEGCITGFVGINGAGKTTTLRSILGLTNNVSGKINFFGMDIKGNESEIKDRIGIVLDDGCFYDELTISEMITKSLSDRLSSCFSNCILLVLFTRSEAGRKKASVDTFNK